MKNQFKKLFCMLLVVVTVFTLFVPAIASFDKATAIAFNKVYKDSIESRKEDDFFKFTTTEYGRVRIYLSASMRPCTVAIYNADQKEVKSWTAKRGTSGDLIYSHPVDAGVYYLRINTKNGAGTFITATGSYQFRLSFTPEKKGASPVDAYDNHSFDKAVILSAAQKHDGKMLEEKKEEDFFKFTIKSAGTVTVKTTSKMQDYRLYLYTEGKSVLWSDTSNALEEGKKDRADEFKFELSAGSYFLKISNLKSSRYCDRNKGYKGDYTLTYEFKSAGQTSVEPNDSLVNPNAIAFGKQVKGHLSMTDKRDYYSITIPKGGETLAFTSAMSSYNVRILDIDGKEVWSDKDNKLAEGAETRNDAYVLDLTEGRYFVVVDGGTGAYNFQFDKKVTVAKVKTVKYSQTVTTMTLWWTKIKGADGYELFVYDEAKKDYVKLATTTSRKHKLTKLTGGTTYKYKVRAFKKVNDCPVYGEFSDEKSTTTKPAKAVISSVKADVKSATVSWKEVTGASGYRVFYTTDKDFDYAKKIVIKDEKARSYKVEKLKSGKTYYFKVRGYKVYNGKNVYGNLSSVKSAKIK